MRRQTRSARPTTFGPVRPAVALVALAAALVVVACTPPSAAERVAQQRSEYFAHLNSFNVVEQPVVPAMEMEAGAMDDGAMDDGAMDDGALDDGAMEEGMAMQPVEVRQDVVLDIVLEKQGRSEGLSGITLDVQHADAQEVEKARYRVYVETGGLVNGSSIQVTHVLEDVDFVEGDRFQAEERLDVPAQSQVDYREFNDAGESGDDV